jgi:ribosome production factor 1
MGSGKVKLSAKAALPFKSGNKLKRQELFTKQKKARENETRDDRMRRKREEAKNPALAEERRRRNVPLTIDRKRTWDAVDQDVDDGLGVSVDVERLKKQKLEEEAELNKPLQDDGSDVADGAADDDDDRDSMIDFASDVEDEQHEGEKPKPRKGLKTATERATSPVQSATSTQFSLMPEALATKFPSLFSKDAPPEPKILITTSLNSTLYREGELLTNFFPNSVFIRRSAHRYGHKYSIKEISSFATKRNYTAVVVLNEDQKRPSGLDIVHLPAGPMFHFSVTNWVEGKKIPGHGNSTGHNPELILNNFRTVSTV